jgi:hypothetical protein
MPVNQAGKDNGSHYEAELKTIKEAIEKAKNLRYRAEARLEQLEAQRDEILRELDELGVAPERLDEEIARLEREIERLLAEAWQHIPKELVEK